MATQRRAVPAERSVMSAFIPCYRSRCFSCVSLITGALGIAFALAPVTDVHAAVPDMQTAAFAAEFGRALERLLIVLTGAMAMYLGYRLFALVSSEAGELIAKGSGWSIRLVRVGPGVFFALFGASIVVYAMKSSPTVSYMSGLNSEDQSRQAIDIHGGFSPLALKALSKRDSIVAMNTLDTLLQSSPQQLTEEQVGRLRHAVNNLEPLKRYMVDAELGAGRYDEWYRLSQLQQANAQEFSNAMAGAETRQRYNVADSLMSETIGAKD